MTIVNTFSLRVIVRRMTKNGKRNFKKPFTMSVKHMITAKYGEGLLRWPNKQGGARKCCGLFRKCNGFLQECNAFPELLHGFLQLLWCISEFTQWVISLSRPLTKLRRPLTELRRPLTELRRPLTELRRPLTEPGENRNYQNLTAIILVVHFFVVTL